MARLHKCIKCGSECYFIHKYENYMCIDCEEELKNEGNKETTSISK